MIQDWQSRVLQQVAEQMLLAATTAPKGRGVTHLVTALFQRAEVERLAGEMARIGEQQQLPSFIRDAENLRQHAAVAVLLGTTVEPLGLKYCGFCGHANCDANRAARGICAFNTGDLGIAVGSAVAVAGAMHADNRVMYSMGMAAIRSGMLAPAVRIAYGIPLSATEKNPFFDRK